jgi:CheY-like chemotaxis protein
MVRRVPYCGQSCNHAEKGHWLSGLQNAYSCNLSESSETRRSRSGLEPAETTPILVLVRGTDPELGRVSDGDGLVMMTNAATTDIRHHGAPATTAQKVVIVNGSPEMLEMLETVLDAGHYDVVFVESSEHAYSQIKRVQPNLVILCVRIDDGDGFQVLSMLKLDEETRGIPVMTYTHEGSSDDEAETYTEPSEAELFPPSKAAAWMN